MDPNPQCPDCFALKELLRRAESQLKRATADLKHLQATGHQQRTDFSDEIAASMPDPDTVPEKTDPTQRFVKRPALDF